MTDPKLVDPVVANHTPVAAGGFSASLVALIVIFGNKHGLGIDTTEAVLLNTVIPTAVGFITKSVQDFLRARDKA